MAKGFRIGAVLLLVLFVATAALAESPREQLTQLVTQLQNAPNDVALREKIIKLAQEVKPAPAIPEEARRHFVKAVALQKEAKNVADYDQPIDEFRQALTIAPWWGDAYYNLAVSLEASGRFNEAKDNVKLYLLTNPDEKDARDAQDKIYVLEAKQEKVAKEKRAEEAKYGWILGRWNCHYAWSGTVMEWRGMANASKEGNRVVFAFFGERSGTYPNGESYTQNSAGFDPILRATLTESGEIEWQENMRGDSPGVCPTERGWQNINPVISDDRRTISFTRTDLYAGKCTPTGKSHEFTFTRD